jgi:BASS family bile acid:Na+ symporter
MDIGAMAIQIFSVAVFVMMVAIGLRTNPADSLHLMRRWDKGIRAFAAIYVFVPAVTLLLVGILDMPAAVEATLIALSVSPMLPTLPADLAKLGAEHRYSVSLEVIGALAALIAAPFVFWMVSRIIHIPLHIKTSDLLLALGKGLFLPIALGILLNLLFPTAVARLIEPIVKLVSLALLVCSLIILWNARGLIAAELDWRILFSVLVFVLTGLAAGHLLGGGDAGDGAALALTAASRHIGFAIAIATAVAPQSVPTVIGAALIYFVARGVIVLPYQVAMQKLSKT